GAGKTTVAELLKEKGGYVVDCDIAARKIVEKGSPVIEKLKEAFGEDIVFENGELNRKALAKKAFSTKESEKILNKITHPAITELVRKDIIENKDNFPFFVVDAALLFESELYDYCNKTVVVCADENIRLQRIMSRDSITREEALLRINAQPDEQYYLSKADVIIKNNGGEISLADLF
ncbi:MAG: dephospho-CoA kinase, partial [Clostridia bacterium]|nr:dephospho-CoA kinase [Clostridia bacterium]